MIQRASPAGIKNVVQQQFEVAGRILDAGLVPIVEPEVDIHCPQKAGAEALLKEALLEKLNGLPSGQQVMLKLTLPEQPDFHADCVRQPRVVRVVALSGGYTQEEADARLRKNHGMVASFSRCWWKDCRSIKPIPSSTPRWRPPFRGSMRRPSPEPMQLGYRVTAAVDSRVDA